jgi:hypothetical protein
LKSIEFCYFQEIDVEAFVARLSELVEVD